MTIIRAEIGTTGNVETIEVTGDAATDIATAIQHEHPCDDTTGCDIARALEDGFPLWAADLLMGATECPLVTAAVEHYEREGLEFDRKAKAECDAWLETETWTVHSRECGACGSICFGDDTYTPEECPNCGAGELKPTDRVLPDYADHIEGIAKEYGERAMALLERVKAACVAEGFTVASEPFEMFGDDFRWSMLLQRPNTDDDDNKVDVTVEIAEEREYEGGEGWGINFGLDLVEMGGRILGGLTPFNYTEHCWVNSRASDEVATRWQILEDADVSPIPDLLTN